MSPPAAPNYGADPKTATPEQRAEAREALRAIVSEGTDEEFDEVGHVLSLGIEIERALRGIDMATGIAEKLGARAVGAQMAITHKGHEYHVTIERCPSCEQRKAAAGTDPEPAPEAE